MKILNPPTLSKALLAVLCLTLLVACSKKQVTHDYKFDEAFAPYIGAYTTGKISRQSTIKVRLNENAVKDDQIGVALSENPFTFEPELEGKAIWIDARTLQFESSKPMPTAQFYTATFELGKFVSGLEDKLQTFPFQFETEQQNFEVSVLGIETIDKQKLIWQALNGTLTTADYEFPELVEKVLTVEQDDNNFRVKWSHSLDGREHTFRVDSLQRGTSASMATLSWDGDALGIDKEGKTEVRIPALGEFAVMEYKTYNDPDQYVALTFSDPIRKAQDLNGLIRLGDMRLRYTVEGNDVKVFPAVRTTGEHTLTVSPGVQNILGHKLKEGKTFDIQFEELKPEVRITGNGNILPRAGAQLPFAFEAVSLKAVDLEIMKIYENNILQFLQVNDLEGDRELQRVGKVVHRSTVRLDGDKSLNLHQWNRHIIDLGSLINSEPGAIYRVTVNFGKEQSIYTCEAEAEAAGESESKKKPAEEEGAWSDNGEESSYWEYYDDTDYGDTWDNRDNPCHKAYYTYESRGASRNILASDLGIIAKRGTDGTMTIAVNDLHTTAPLGGVDIEIYDYQRQVLKRLSTNSEGIATADVDIVPFVIVAKQGNQRGYLKLGDGYALSLSKFDISGQRYYKGVKGFIYGERGVWRPGDTIFSTFMLEDELSSLPADHPVTFTLTNSLGQLVNKSIKTSHVNGVYTYQTATADNAPTGNYNLRVDVGGASFDKTIKIETVMPNRLKIKIDFGKEFLSKEMENMEGNLEVAWLHGAVARDLAADVSVALTSMPTSFKRFADYEFDDPVRQFDSERQTIFEGNVDANGMAKVPLKIELSGNAPGMLNANFVTKVFEPGGAFSTDRFSLPYYPYERFVGIKIPKGDKARGMILTDTDHKVQIVTVDADGNPKGERKVEMTLYKLDWKWWWDQTANSETTYNEKFYQEQVSKDTIRVRNGVGTWKFNVKYPAWGRYMVRACDEGGHCTGQVVYIDWPGWAGRAQKDNPGGATMLTFSADKENYKVGENVTLTIPTGKAGRALVSLESGAKVISTHWVESNGLDAASYTFPATAEMAPNIYAHVSLIQPHAQTVNDLPMRMYGVIPIEITDPKTELKPKILVSDVLAPMERVDVGVSEATGQAMTYTVAIVDEGLLDLTRFETPNPWASFYAREALDVKTWDLYDKVIGAYGADLTKLLGIGGDDGMAPKEGSKQNRFRPVVKFMGPFSLKPGETKKHSFMMPNYVGAVRTMVVARNGSAYGASEKSSKVRKPLMVLGTLPRVLGPGEELRLPVTVFAMENHVKDVNVTLDASDIFTINGPKTKSLSFARPGDELVNFELAVKERIGKGTVKVTARSGSEVAIYHIDIDVRNPNPKVVNVTEKAVDANQSWTQSVAYPGMVGTNKGTLELSTIPPINLGKRLKYLLEYPHGCVEQTTSSVFPQLYVSNLIEMPAGMQQTIDKNIRAGLDRLETFQQASGGLSYWPGTGEVDEWGTNYAGNFIVEAKNKGYRVSQTFLTKWIAFQKKAAKNWSATARAGQLIQGDRLYLLALAGSPELGAMNRLRETPGLDNVAQWRLAAAYKLAGQPETAVRLSKDLAIAVPKYQEQCFTYGNDVRDQAIILECIGIIGNRVRGAELSKKVANALSKDEWMSTQTTGYSLIAMAKYAGLSQGQNSKMEYAYRINGGNWVDGSSAKPIAQIDLAIGNGTQSSIEIKNKGAGILFARVIAEGIPAKGDQDASQNHVSLAVNYFDMQGDPLDPTTLEQGTDFVAEITLKNPGTKGDLDELALTQIFPSGWEIHNTRMDGTGFEKAIAQPDYQDIRDDRVFTYFDLGSPGQKARYPWAYPTRKTEENEKTFRILLNASYLGKFYLPTVYVEAMYDNSISARIPGKWVTVVTPENS
jgi:alpha-2-macroglobulin